MSVSVPSTVRITSYNVCYTKLLRGIFPIVHGVRTLALEQRILVTNTFKRIEALIEAGLLRELEGKELAEALSYNFV